jgi:clan AA aspartic protease (TIGR02281 family)
MRGRGAVLIPLLGLMLMGAGEATVADLNEAGKAAYARGDFATAERLFSQALAKAPDEPLLYYHRGITLMRMSRWQEASTALQAALRLDPSPDVAQPAREGLRSIAPLLREAPSRKAATDDTAVTLRRIGGNWFAQVRVNNARTARFLVDTGATTCVISPDLAGALDIRPDRHSGPVQLQTISGLTSGHVVTILSLRVGEVEAQDVLAVVHDVGPSMDGILGNTFLSRFTVTLDPERGLLRLSSR